MNKYVAARAVGVDLVQVWEDDWARDPELVKRMLAQRLGVADVVDAGLTEVVNVSFEAGQRFLEVNHLRGGVSDASGAFFVGLKGMDGVLRAVLALREEVGSEGVVMVLGRYAASGSVVGGFAKLLGYAAGLFSPDVFVVFDDHEISDRALYEGAGFVADEVFPAGYKHVVRSARVDPAVLLGGCVDDTQRVKVEGLPRVWDAGMTRYRLVLTADSVLC